MRVLQISLDIHEGGASRCVRDLLDWLPAHGVQTEAFVARGGNPPDPRARIFRHSWERWLDVLEALPGSTDWRHRGSIRALGTVDAKSFDLVHLHNIHNGCASLRAIHDLCRRKPVVWTLHDEWACSGGLTCDLRGRLSRAEVLRMMSGLRRLLGYSPYHDSFRTRNVRRLLDHWMPRPRSIIAPSQFIADRAHRSGRFPHIPIHVVRNGVRLLDLPETEQPRAEARRLFELPENSPVVLLVAPHLLQPHKGVDFGLQAIEKVGLPTVHVLLVGRGGAELRSRIRFPTTCLTACEDATLARAYRAADVTLVPSLTESFSLVAAESMACGTPVVSFAVGGLVELLGNDERGRMAKPFAIDDLAVHVRTLLKQPEQRRILAAAGQAWVREQCCRDHYLRSLVAVYRQALTNDVAGLT